MPFAKAGKADMSPAKQRLIEDRALRDAAKAIVSKDLAYLKSDAGRKGLAERAKETGADYLHGVADGVLDLAERNKGRLAGGAGLALAALLGWIFRDDLAAAVNGLVEGFTAGEGGSDGTPDTQDGRRTAPAEFTSH